MVCGLFCGSGPRRAWAVEMKGDRVKAGYRRPTVGKEGQSVMIVWGENPTLTIVRPGVSFSVGGAAT